MDSRRTVLKKMLVGTASAAVVPGVASAALESAAGSQDVASFTLPTGPAPWWLLAPVALGSPLKYGWYVAGLSPVERGASVLTLAHTSGRKARVHVCGHHGRPRGVAHSSLVDLVLMDGGSGAFRTDEKLGRVVLGLADRMRVNETNPRGDLKPIARMMPHDDRVERFGPDTLI